MEPHAGPEPIAVERTLDTAPVDAAMTPVPAIGSIMSVETRHQMAALTFDDGPDPEFTPRLLDVLDKHRAQATFFMVGKAAQQYPEIVARVARSGHAIGNHS